MRVSAVLGLVVWLALAGPLRADPVVDLPPEAPAGPTAGPVVDVPPETELPRETAIENALGAPRPTSSSAFGGYGELTLNMPRHGDAIVDMRRLVLFFGHDFDKHIRLYTEVEFEHAVASASDAGEAEVEQAYLDGMWTKKLNLRGGLLIMPVGIINVYHEPSSFNGVDRPDVDDLVIPSTWREPGVGIFGELHEGLRYQLYLVNGFDANGFTAESAIHEGHQEAQLAHAADFGGVARLDYEPVLGTVLGASGYFATAGNSLKDTVGRVPVTLLEADARTRRGGLTARAEVAFLFIGDARKLDQALAAGTPEQIAAGPVAKQSRGGYLEVGYDLFHLVPCRANGQSLTAFARFDYADTQAAMPAGFAARKEFRRYSGVGGVVWRPIPQVALKADYRHREFGAGPSNDEVATAITWLF